MNRLLAALLAAASCATGAQAQEAVADAQTAPPFAQLLGLAQRTARTTALEADEARARGLAEQARARPNPSLSVYAENFVGDRTRNATDQQQTTFQVDQPIELGGKRSARIAASEAGIAVAQARLTDGRLDRGRVAVAGHSMGGHTAAMLLGMTLVDPDDGRTVDLADRRIGVAEAQVAEVEADLRIARALVDAGKEARLRQLQAETERDTLQAELATAQAQRAAAFARLSALAGRSTPFTALAESLLEQLNARPSIGLVDPMQTTMVRVANAEREAAARAVTVQQRLAAPDITAQLGVRQLRIARGPAAVAGISVPLPFFDRNRGNIAAARAELQGAEARAAVARLDAEAGLRATLAMVEAADRRAAAAERSISTAQEGYRLARIAYEAGKSPLIELIVARRNVGLARGAVLDAAAARLDARADLARLQGFTITGEPVQ